VTGNKLQSLGVLCDLLVAPVQEGGWTWCGRWSAVY